ncbi:LPS export ABC transporter periplasmic protein LptC [Wenyingzhuangia marina]|uniref:LPS export ABC transporter protein LptC n=1 Tax=Wenyingzhuangia marina TaxID=1195760 RepID=A0A1M5VZD8_9FLAO|nr:LPS export ABC transporter periplasmic protein LptC [Wenyingzhuangia marina]GGF76930.1 LPS export ABC transporter periplasmic protein LptC [Wenyingzhuangia marina]SHH80538.1 LPS export ABC transporter protein LptC [Wenyingzhuangia marina]
MSQKSNFVFILKYLSKISLILVVLVSCKNSSKEINDFLADKNLPVGVSENVNLVRKDSGIIVSRMITPLYWDYTNKKLNPYYEFPKGVKIVTINRLSRDSVTVTGDYAISYANTAISEIIGHVVVVNHENGVVLNTDQMYWDQKEDYYFTEQPFTIYTEKDTMNGVGFESESNLNNWILNNTKGDFIVDQKEE